MDHSSQPGLQLCSKQAIYIAVYIVFGASHAILIKATSSADRTLPYNPVSVTLAIEFCKLCGACVMYFTWADNQSFDEKLKALKAKAEIGRLYAIPALLYCVYNALMFYAIALVGPGTYRVLINVKVLVAGVMLRLAGAKVLSYQQWVGLVLLVCACGVEQWGSFDWNIGFDALVMVGIMAFCSAGAGVVNQMLLQTRQTAVLEHGGRHVWQNNIFMYAWSSAINTLYLGYTAPEALSLESFSNFTTPVYAIIGFSCFLGFATAFLLAEASVLVKEYANFFDMLLTVFIGWAWLGIPVKSTLVVAVVMVSVSLYLYNTTAPAPAAPVDPAGGGVPLQTIGVVATSTSASAAVVAAQQNAADRAPLLAGGDAATPPSGIERLPAP